MASPNNDSATALGDLGRLALLLQQSVASSSTTQRKNYESALQQASLNSGFIPLLITLLQKSDVDAGIRQLAAIYFKNYCKRGWTNGLVEAEGGITQANRSLIKQNLLSLMLTTPKPVQAQLREALSLIALEDFPSDWAELLAEIISQHLILNDLPRVEAALETLHGLFVKYRSVCRSDAVLLELKGVLQQFQEPFFTLFKGATSALCNPEQSNSLDRASRIIMARIFDLLLEIYYSFNVLDLPEFFEDNMQTFCQTFLHFLSFQHVDLQPESEDLAGSLENIKTHICRILILYANKYQEEFESNVRGCVTAVWELLTSLDHDKECYDELVSSGIHFLSSVANTNWADSPFRDSNTLKLLCEKIVLPNITLRDSDIENFNNNPEEYLRRDLEAADQKTRRRAAIELVKSLCKLHEEQVCSILMQYVTNLLGLISATGGDERTKDACVYIIIAISAKSQSRIGGVNEVNQRVNVEEFFLSSLAPELRQDAPDRALIRASVLKYLTLFRKHIATQHLEQVVPFVAKHIIHNKEVVHSYAAVCLDRLLSLREETAGEIITLASRAKLRYRLNVQNLKPTLVQVLEPLLVHVTQRKGHIPENEHLMKTIQRIFTFLDVEARPYSLPSLQRLMNVVKEVSHNPANPKFSHFLFESIVTIVEQASAQDPLAMENAVLPVLAVIVEQQTHEFVPYCLQTLAVMLDHAAAPSQAYSSLFAHLMNPPIWTAAHANVPGVVRLLSAYFKQSDKFLDLINSNIERILERFQYCLSHRKLEFNAFELLNAMFRFLPLGTYQAHFQTLITVLLSQLHTGKGTVLLKNNFVISLSFFIYRTPQIDLLQVFNKIQAGLAVNVMTNLWLPAAKTMSDFVSKKICIVALSSLCANKEVLLHGEDKTLLRSCLIALGSLLSTGLANSNDCIDQDDAEDALSGEANGAVVSEFEVAFARLKSTDSSNKDMIPEIKDVPATVRMALMPHMSLIGPILAGEQDPKILLVIDPLRMLFKQ